MGHYANDCPIPKDVKKSMQITWSDTNSEESASIASEETRYDPNDFLAFIAFIESMNIVIVIVMMTFLMNKGLNS